ncbi:MAG: transglutaminase domain-containing protein [Hoeflea sp.]|nr:transglutaminase domain-containing protein [Hoeflea sp.]
MKATQIFAATSCVLVFVLAGVGYRAWQYRSTAIEAQTQLASQIGMEPIELLASQEQMRQDYRASWHLILGNSFETNLEYATAVTDYLHHNVPLGGKDTAGAISNRLSRAVLLKDEEAYCGDFSTFMNLILKNSGVPSRTVQLASNRYVNGESLGDTHVTVEVWIDNKWTIFDPTFNSTFSCGNKTLIGVAEARACGVNLVAVQHPSTLPGRTVAEHNVPYWRLLENSLATGTMVGSTFIEPVGVPNLTWLSEASTQY